MPAFALSFSNSWTAVVLQASWVCRCTYYVVNNDFAIVSTYLMIFCVEGFTSLLTNASLNKNFFVKQDVDNSQILQQTTVNFNLYLTGILDLYFVQL